MTTDDPKEPKRRVIALLTKEEIEFLEKLALDSSFSTGHRLSMSDSISAFVHVAMSYGVTGKEARTKQDLVEKLLDAIASQSHDRRRFPRFKKNFELQFRKVDSLSAFQKSQTQDISYGGFRIELSCLGKPPVVDDFIEITLKDDEEEKFAPIQAMGRIAWVRTHDGHGDYEIGVRLTYVKPEDKEKFLSCLGSDIPEEAEDTRPE